jgi:CSLREA domain-containing protein
MRHLFKAKARQCGYGLAAVLLALGASAAKAATTATFSNTASITIADNTTASPFPSTINVSGVTPATVTNVRVQLNGLSHTFQGDIDIVLINPQSRRAIVMSDAGGSSIINNLTLSFDATAATAIPGAAAAVSGSVYRPVNYFTDPPDNFPFVISTSLDVAPDDLTTFNLTDPNGVWSLYVVDDATSDVGSIANGWSLTFTVPAVFTVNSTADPGDGTCNASECTLREAINAAGENDLVQFSMLFDSVQTIVLSAGEILINKNITIRGPGADVLTLSGNHASRVFRVVLNKTLSLHGVALRDGRAADVGGAIVSDGNLFLRQVEVSNSTAGIGFSGGGVYMAGGFGVVSASSIHDNRAFGGAGVFVVNASALIEGSTIAHNVANGGSGGGVRIETIPGGNPKTLDVRHSTIAHNRATNDGGIAVASGGGVAVALSLRNSIIANNSGASIAVAGTGATAASRGFNLSSDSGNSVLVAASDQVNVNPRLGPLSLNGGTTSSLALLGGSPALDAGHSSGTQLEQRGITRLHDIAGIAPVPLGDNADIGATEMRPRFVTNTNDSGAGSLRDAINATNTVGSGLDDILFDNTVFNQQRNIDLVSALPDIASDLALHGPGANLLTVRRSPAAADFRVFHNPGATTRSALSGLTIAGGRLASGSAVADVGGGIRSAGPLALSAVHVTGNQAALGAGVALVFASGVIDGSSFSGNTAVGEGGGILFQDSGPHALRVSNTTISGNTVGAAGFGGGIEVIGETGRALVEISSSTIVGNTGDNGGGIDTSAFGVNGAGRVTLLDSIVAGNMPSNFNAVPDGGGGTAVIVSRGFNLSDNYNSTMVPLGSDRLGAAVLSPLGLNGGTVPTHVPQETSPALDAGFSANTNREQRSSDFRRPVDLSGISNAAGGDASDIGAVELQAFDALFQNGFE